MKKIMIVGIALAMGILSVGAGTASAAGPCCKDGKCNDREVVQQFKQETAALASAIKAKDIELREQYGYDGFDTSKVDSLQAEIKVLKGQVKHAAEKYDLPSCCLS